MKNIILFSVFLFSILSCQKDKENAEASLVGSWTINNIYNNSGSSTTGTLGTFVFKTNGTVNYSFRNNGSNIQNNTTWTLSRELVNAGFVKVEKYTLMLGDGKAFITEFGDQTSNAEKNATEIRLQDLNGQYVLSLNK